MHLCGSQLAALPAHHAPESSMDSLLERAYDAVLLAPSFATEALISALIPFSPKPGAESSPSEVVAFLASFGVQGPSPADWAALFQAADDVGLYGEDVGALVGQTAAGACATSTDTVSCAAARTAMNRYYSWLVEPRGWADAEMGRLAREHARQWRVRCVGNGEFVLDGCDEIAPCGASGVSEVVEECAGRTVEAAVEMVVCGVVKRVDNGRRRELLERLGRRAESLVDGGQLQAKNVVMEAVLQSMSGMSSTLQ